MYNSFELIELLKKESYKIEVHQHDALFTVEDSIKLRGKINGAHSKNLFLKNKKNEFFLLSCGEGDNIDLKKISKSLKLGNISFAKQEYLEQYLKIKPGSVSPFALLNDSGGTVNFYLEQRKIDSDLGGTMRLGAYKAKIKDNSKAFNVYGENEISERHRHRYEVNNNYCSELETKGVIFSAFSPDGLLPEILEIPSHPWFIGVQFHPELKSKPFEPHPLFKSFIGAAINRSKYNQ